jgi:hypothetical protein
VRLWVYYMILEKKERKKKDTVKKTKRQDTYWEKYL